MATEGATVPKGTMNEERWNRVLEAAALTFVEKGYPAARMEDVADRLGILKGSLYYYVTSKEDLLYELIRRANRSGLAVIAELRALDGDAPARLRSFIRRWVRHVETHHLVGVIFQHEVKHLSPDRLAEVERERKEMERALRRVIEEGIDEGTFAPSTDAELATRALFLVVNASHGLAHRRSSGARTAIDERLADLLLEGLRAR